MKPGWGPQGPKSDSEPSSPAASRGGEKKPPGKPEPAGATLTLAAPQSDAFRLLMERVQQMTGGGAAARDAAAGGAEPPPAAEQAPPPLEPPAAAAPPAGEETPAEPQLERASVGFEMQDGVSAPAEVSPVEHGLEALRQELKAAAGPPLETAYADPGGEPVSFEVQPCILGRLAPPASLIFTSGEEIAEEFRLLMARVKQIATGRRFRRIGIVSASNGEGKSTVSLGLSVAMAQEQRGVLLIEADLRKPSLESTLQLAPGPALCDWLRGSGSTVRTRRLGPNGPELLGAGDITGFRPDSLGSPRMASLLASAERAYDFVIVDTPPLNAVADAVLLQELLDGVLFVVRARATARDVVLKALSYLKPDKVQGVVFNAPRELLPGRYGYGHRRYAREG